MPNTNNMMQFPKLLFWASLLVIWSSYGLAQDEALYDPEPPPNSAFIRVINATDSKQALAAQMANLVFADIAPASATAYRVITQGQHLVSVGDQDLSLPLTIEAGNSYSIALLGADQVETILPITDTVSRNPAKCGVLFYNLSDQDQAALQVPSRKLDIIGKLSPGTSKLREVNAIDIDMAVLVGSQTIQAFPQVRLKRRTHLSFVLTGSGSQLQAFMSENKTDLRSGSQ